MPSGYKSVPTNEKVAVARESNNPINKTVVSHYGATQGAPTGVQIADNASDAREPEPLDNAFVVNLIIVSLCTMCGDSSRGVCFPTLWLFVESLGGDHENQGFAVALFSAGRIFSSPVLGYLSSVWGYRWVLTIAMLLMAVGCLFYMAAGSLFALYCAQFSIGIGAGILGVFLLIWCCSFWQAGWSCRNLFCGDDEDSSSEGQVKEYSHRVRRR